MKDQILSIFIECADLVQEEVRNNLLEEFGTDVGEGADGTPIKFIDQQAEKVALDVLEKRCDCDILSEEIGLLEGDGQGTVIMDPIDGTSNSVLDIPFYAISLAYTTGTDLDGLQVGYVRNLVTGKDYRARYGDGSFTGKRRLAPKLGEDSNFSVYMGKKAHRDCKRVAFIPRRTRSLGSAALEICMVAEGALDLYFLKTPGRVRSLRITDVAAATLILREAGGEIYDGKYQPLNMSLDPKERSDVIAVYDDRVLEEVMWA